MLLISDFYFTVTWQKDGKVVEEDKKKYQFTDSGSKFQLKVLNLTNDDSGQYTVKASDGSSDNFSAFCLNVVAPGEV